jgi:hypothetical protein
MIRKLLAILLTLVMLICAAPLSVTADIEPPTTLGAPEHFGASHEGQEGQEGQGDRYLVPHFYNERMTNL